MKKQAKHHYSIDHRGAFYANQEAPWVGLPCTVKSLAGGWITTVETLDHLRECLERHWREPGVTFDIETVWEWASESETECRKNYTAYCAPGRYDDAARGMLPGFETA